MFLARQDVISGFQGWCKAQLTFVLLLLQHVVPSISWARGEGAEPTAGLGPGGLMGWADLELGQCST